MSIPPPDDLACIMAREALAQIKRIGELGAFCNEDVTVQQEATIILALRNYFIVRTESLERQLHGIEGAAIAAAEERET
jgi:hypothetical protein